MKRKVVSFFAILILLALVLTSVVIFNFKGLNAFVVSNPSIKSYSIPNVPLENKEGMIFGLVILIFIFISALILSKLEKRRERHHIHLVSNKQPFSRKLIPISYD